MVCSHRLIILSEGIFSSINYINSSVFQTSALCHHVGQTIWRILLHPSSGQKIISLCSPQPGPALRKFATSVFRLKRITHSAAEQQRLLPEHDVSCDLQTPTYQSTWYYNPEY